MKFNFIEKGIKKGDRVFYTRKRGTYIGYGETGTALTDSPLMIGSLIPVNWDKEGSCKYGLLGCPNHHGWAARAEDLEKIL